MKITTQNILDELKRRDGKNWQLLHSVNADGPCFWFAAVKKKSGLTQIAKEGSYGRINIETSWKWDVKSIDARKIVEKLDWANVLTESKSIVEGSMGPKKYENDDMSMLVPGRICMIVSNLM